MRLDYGTATAEEINEGFKIAVSIARQIKALPNPAVQQMVKNLLAMIYISPMKDTRK